MYTSCSQGVLHQSHRSAYRFRFFSIRIRCSESQSHGRWKTTYRMGISGIWRETGRREKGYPETRGVWMCLRVLSWKPRSILYIPWNDTTIGELGSVYQYRSIDGSRSQIIRLIFPRRTLTLYNVNISPDCFFLSRTIHTIMQAFVDRNKCIYRTPMQNEFERTYNVTITGFACT